MFEAGDYAAGSDGAMWSTSRARRAAQGVRRRHGVKQYANFQGVPRTGEREQIERLAAGRSLGPSPMPGGSKPPMMHQNARMGGRSAAPNLGKHAAADIHTTAEQGRSAPALRGAPRTVAIQSGRNTNRGGNRVSYSVGRRSR